MTHKINPPKKLTIHLKINNYLNGSVVWLRALRDVFVEVQKRISLSPLFEDSLFYRQACEEKNELKVDEKNTQRNSPGKEIMQSSGSTVDGRNLAPVDR